MAGRRFHGLKKIKIRASWNKYNLYNLARSKGSPLYASMTFFQQKWLAKSNTRAYHGEQIREGQWERMFSPLINAVVPMDHKYLADHDGSELAAGRGSGLERPFDPSATFGKKQVPYMHMTYAPVERRLDMAIFRALFASSARQARQFVVHGAVKVNGQKMPYPGYLLNPGDMFQVDPERVMYATGAKKGKEQSKEGRRLRRIQKRGAIGVEKSRAQHAEQRAAKKAAENSEDDVETKLAATRPVLKDSSEARKQAKEQLALLQAKMTKIISATGGKALTAKRKQQYRACFKKAKRIISQASRMPIGELEKETKAVFAELSVLNQMGRAEAQKQEEEAEDPTSKKSNYNEKVTEEKKRVLFEKIRKARENPIDETKPYATPWQPRPYMSPFAFIPRYLEVNHNICSAVYLRDPVVRPKLAEVPTPFDADTMQLAFNWYLRRR